MKNKIVELKHLSAGYDQQIVLNNVNFTVYNNDFIGIIGPNGGGKTTLLKIILGLLKPFSGHIHFYNNSQKVPNINIGYLPQINAIDTKFPISVKEVIQSGLVQGNYSLLKRKTNKNDIRTQEIMEMVGVDHIAGKAIGELSGGQKQRTFLGRALISDPSLLILDEPDTYVDHSFEKELYELLKKLSVNTAILLVSHDVGMISTFVNSIACVNKDLHYHPSNEINEEVLRSYNCPIDLITHGTIPHRVLKKHNH
ncbi:MAG: ATP-binding cassette domain-containing protein [Bacteroidales bacterium]|nr:ATP-binding cassette domain-containing protein [Bacteroidales bacterium]